MRHSIGVGAGTISLRGLPWAAAEFHFGLLRGLPFQGAPREAGLPANDVPLASLSFQTGNQAMRNPLRVRPPAQQSKEGQARAPLASPDPV